MVSLRNSSRTGLCEWIFARTLLVLFLCLPGFLKAAEIRIGVLAWLGAEEAESHWVPFVNSLQAALPSHQFVLRQLDLDGIGEALERREVDFLVTNPGHYVTLEAQYGISRLATAVASGGLDPAHVVGSAVVVLSARRELDKLEDLRGRRLAAVSREAFGGYQLAWAELARRGIDPEDGDLKTRFTGFPMTSVLDVVARGEADAGVIRACLLERLVQQGRVPASLFRVLSARIEPGLDCQTSSDLYPGWAFAASPHTSPDISRQVVLALLSLPATDGGQTWSVPADYQSVHGLLRELKIGPYRFLRDMDLESLARRYRPALGLVVAMLLLWIGYTVRVERLVQRRTQELRGALAERQALENRAHAEQERMEHLSRLSILGELSSTFAHELNQPLATIGNYAQSLIRRIDRGTLSEEAVRQASEEIASEAQRAAQILAGIRAFSRKRRRVREPHQVSAMVRDVVSLFQGIQAQVANVTITDNLHSDAGWVLVDPLQFHQVLLNLLKNADDSHRAAGARGEAIEVLLAMDGTHISVSVGDRGVGLTQEAREHLFEHFFTTKPDGLGLGLSICASIAEAHGGRLEALAPESVPGAIFRFTLPRFDESAIRSDHDQVLTTP